MGWSGAGVGFSVRMEGSFRLCSFKPLGNRRLGMEIFIVMGGVRENRYVGGEEGNEFTELSLPSKEERRALRGFKSWR